MTLIRSTKRAATASLVGTIALVGVQMSPALGQQSSRSAREAALSDFTGIWVAIINEDWRWRMLTPPKGDYASVPINTEGRRVADTWDSSQDGSCKAYGAAGLMRMPIRVRIAWERDDVLRIESDAGQQTRRVYFAQIPSSDEKTLQGHSVALWELALPPGDGFGFGTVGSPPAGGSLKVVTTNLQGGWLRRNGVPYGENARVTEYYNRFATPDGNEWFVVTTIVEDPQYLLQPYITSSHFRREPTSSKWNPRPCKN